MLVLPFVSKGAATKCLLFFLFSLMGICVREERDLSLSKLKHESFMERSVH